MNNAKHLWIKFFSKSDMSLYYYFRQALPILDAFNSSVDYDINQIIELYNIKQIINAIDCPQDFDSEKFEYYKSLIKEINKTIGIFFCKIGNDNFLSTHESVDWEYSLDFLKLCGFYKVVDRLDEDVVKILLNSKCVSLEEILQCGDWVEKFDSIITEYMLTKVKSAEIILRHHLQKKDERSNSFCLPKSLIPAKKIELLERYIESDEVNPNFLYLIKYARDNQDLPICPKMRLNAEKAYNAYWKKHFEKNPSARYGAQCRFADIENEREESSEGLVASYIFSRKWVKEHLDFPTLLNNFIFLFDFVDSKLRCSFVTNEDMFLTSLLLGGVRGIDDYKVGVHFEIGRMIANSQMQSYCLELESNGKSAEDLFEWFFNSYIKQEFGVEGFVYNKSSKNVSMLEKCRTLCSEMDGVLQQYKLYQTEGYIDRDLLSYSSDGLNPSEVKSLQKIKYIYGKKGDFYREANSLMTHDLMYGSEFDVSKYENFAMLLFRERVRLENFKESAQKNILWLIERGSVLKKNGYLVLNEKRFLVIRDVCEKKCTTWEHQDAASQAILKNLIDKGDVNVGNTLLSIQECEYYNFVMNRKQFSNGWNLRNSLIHGSSRLDGTFLYTAYIELLKIFVLIVIKINEEFRVKFG